MSHRPVGSGFIYCHCCGVGWYWPAAVQAAPALAATVAERSAS